MPVVRPIALITIAAFPLTGATPLVTSPSTVAPVTVIRSESEETAVTSASAGKPKSSLVIVTVLEAPSGMLKLGTVATSGALETSLGFVTVTFTTKSARPDAWKVTSAASSVGELLMMLKVATPLTGLTDSSNSMSGFDV